MTGDAQIEHCMSSLTPEEGSVATLNMSGSGSETPKKKLQRRFRLQECGKREIRKYSLTATYFIKNNTFLLPEH